MSKDKERIKELEDEIKVLWEDRATHSSRVVGQKKKNAELRKQIKELENKLKDSISIPDDLLDRGDKYIVIAVYEMIQSYIKRTGFKSYNGTYPSIDYWLEG